MVSACREGRTWGPCLRIGFDQEAGLRKGPHVFTYSAICDVPEETLVAVTAWLLAHRCRIGTRVGRRAGTVRVQAKVVLRWFRDDASYNMLLTALRAIGERANAELKQRWKCLRRIRLCPSRIGDVVAAGIVLFNSPTRKLLRNPQYLRPLIIVHLAPSANSS